MCSSSIKEGILSDEMGLGKTITALAHIVFHAKQQLASYHPPTPPAPPDPMLSADNIDQSLSQENSENPANPTSSRANNRKPPFTEESNEDDVDHCHEDDDDDNEGLKSDSTYISKRMRKEKLKLLLNQLERAQALNKSLHHESSRPPSFSRPHKASTFGKQSSETTSTS